MAENDALAKTLSDWEQAIKDNATSYTVFRYGGRGKRERKEFDTLTAAIADAQSDPRAMVYAITAAGRSVMIPREQWETLK